MSRETAEARAESSQNWSVHRAHCGKCAEHSHSWDDLCDSGYRIWTRHRAAAEDLAESRLLDRAPPPGMDSLF